MVTRKYPLIALLLFAISATSQATEILDQSYEPGLTGASAAGSDNAQTFTVGVSGQLTAVEMLLRVDGTAPLLFDVRTTTGTGAPIESDTTTLASLSVAAASLSSLDWHRFDLTSFGINVTAGQVLAAVIRGTPYFAPVCDPVLGGACSVGYAGGARWIRDPSSPFFIDNWIAPPTAGPTPGSQDMNFRTFVDASVPEPAVILLLGFGLIGLRLTRR